MSYKIQRRGDLLAVISADTGRQLSGHADRAAAMTEVSGLYAGDWDQADCEGIHQIVCIDSNCERVFMGFTAMAEHADAVHTFDDIREMVCDAIREKYNQDGDRNATPPIPYRYAWVRDLAVDWVVFEVNESGGANGREKGGLYQASYSLVDNDVVLGAPQEVVRRTVYEPVTANDGDETPDTNGSSS